MPSPPTGTRRSAPRIDVHVHLAGVGTQESGCWMSPAFRHRPAFVCMRALFGITRRQMETTVDQDWAALVSSLVARSELDYVVALGFDGVYDSRGELDLGRSQMIVPEDWVFEVCGRYANLLPGPSLNPYRKDALEALECCLERGAVLIKWLPIVQAFDPASPRVRPFLERVAASGVPLLVHAGSGEVTFATVDRTVGHLRSLEPALDLGVRIICAHSAAPIHLSHDENEIPLLRRMLIRYANLWVDNSGLTNPSRFRHLPRFAEDPLIRNRTLHGSDFPVITNAFYYPGRIPVGSIAEIERESNTLQRDVSIKRAIGFGDAPLLRPASVLANLDRWTS